MNDLILFCLIALLMGAIGGLSYFLGKRTERNANFEKKKKTMDQICRIRGTLNDPAVVERLHDRFKR